MYPQRQLTLLADRKAVLRQSIARRRDQLAMDAMQVAKPMEWLDRALVLWSRIPPLAKLVSIPVGLLVVKRTFFPHQKIKFLGALLRWCPTIFGVMRGVRKANKNIRGNSPIVTQR